MAAKVIPTILYGTLWSFPAAAKVDKLRGAILRATWGFSRRLRCMEVVMAVLHNPRHIEPWSALSVRALLDTRRILLKSVDRQGRFNSMLSTRRNARERKGLIVGPVAGALRAARDIDCDLLVDKNTLFLVHPISGNIDLLSVDIHFLKSVLESASRYAIMSLQLREKPLV